MDFPKISLEGKVALVTGGSRGIGRASALAFASAGANVVVASRKIADLEPVAAEIKAKGVKGLAVASHIARVEDSKTLVDTVMKEFGRIDILFNNAGTNPFYGPLINVEEWAWDTTVNVNLKGQFFLSQLAARIMKTQHSGNIISTSSVGGLRASDLAIYDTTKAALIMLTQCMAKEWGKYNIRVNAICPGVIRTKLSELLWKDEKAYKHATENCPLGRIGEPDEVGNVVLFLASDLSSYVTGTTIVIDGGEMLGAPSFPDA